MAGEGAPAIIPEPMPTGGRSRQLNVALEAQQALVPNFVRQASPAKGTEAIPN